MEIAYTVLEYFLVFSFLGWCTEVAYQAAAKGLVVNRGFLNGPVCPIYGFGVLAVFLMLQLTGEGEFYEQNALVVFLFGVILSTSIELFGGWILDKAFHARWWDYSTKPFNLHGYICLEFSLIWGLAILIVVRAVYPMLSRMLGLIPHKIGWVFIVIFCVAYLADFTVSVSVMIGLNKRLAEIDEMQRRMRVVSNDLSKRIGENALESAQRIEEVRVQAALAKTEVKQQIRSDKEVFASDFDEYRRELEQKRAELLTKIMNSRHFGAGRLLRAFPDIKHHEHGELLELLKERIR